MRIALDVGNSQVTVGAIDGRNVVETGRIDTALISGDTWPLLERRLAGGGHGTALEGAIIASVVPAATEALQNTLRDHAGVDPLIVGPHLDLGIQMGVQNPEEVGADRIVNAAAAWDEYRRALIVVDLGTAITFDVVDHGGSFAGGAIAPGVATASNALAAAGAQLYAARFDFPPRAIGTSTDEAIRSGILFGTAAMVDGMIRRMVAELRGQTAGKDVSEDPMEDIFVLATGGHAALVAPHSATIRKVDGLLTLKGLMLLEERNR